MLKHATAATTRTVRRGGDSRDRPESLLTAAEIVSSPETGLAYRIQHLLGEGGFGQVYLANRIGRSAEVPETVCIKVSRRIDGWLREAYFGQLLDGHPRAIRVFDAFPLLRPDVAKFDATKFSWVGSITKDIYVAYVLKGGPIETYEQAKQGQRRHLAGAQRIETTA